MMKTIQCSLDALTGSHSPVTTVNYSRSETTCRSMVLVTNVTNVPPARKSNAMFAHNFDIPATVISWLSYTCLWSG